MCPIPDLALVAVRNDVVIRQLEVRPPVRHILAATLAGGVRLARGAAGLEILVEVGAEFEATNRTLALAG